MQPMALSPDLNLVCIIRHGMPCFSTLKSIQTDIVFNEMRFRFFENCETSTAMKTDLGCFTCSALIALLRSPSIFSFG